MAGVHMRRVLRRAVPQCTMGAGAVLLVLALLRRGGGKGGIPRDGPLYLGLDMSTQSLKCTVLGADLRVAYTAAINYDEALPEFATRGGVHHDVRRPCASPPSLPDPIAATRRADTRDRSSARCDHWNLQPRPGCQAAGAGAVAGRPMSRGG